MNVLIRYAWCIPLKTVQIIYTVVGWPIMIYLTLLVHVPLGTDHGC